ncbi:MAG: GntR family transcriptional regulator [Nitriliruptoraceae bacterium]
MTDKRASHRRVPGVERLRAVLSEATPLAGEGKGQRLHEILEDLVASCDPGTRLPSERELASRYEVARMTVRGAISRLESQGLVHRVQGQGTFVSEPRLAQPATLTSFSEDMAARGMTPGSIVLAQEVVPAPDPVAVRLRLPLGEPVVRIERVRSGDGEPIALERSHLPERRFPGLESVDLATHSLYRTLAEDYDTQPASSEQRIAAVELSPADAHLLHVAASTPALRIERVTRDRQGQPIEFVRSVYRGDRFELHTDQYRDLSAGTPRASSDG